MEIVANQKHGIHEDVIALSLGTLMVALGVTIYSKATLLVGGMAGMALIVQYTSGMNFWIGFSLINLPFYLLGVRQLGWVFVLRTFLAVSLVSLFSRLTGEWIDFSFLNATYAAVMAGTLCGTGLLMLFRHRTGLGGLNILAILLQERFGLRAGYFQLAVDLAILCAAFFVLSPGRLMLSVLSAIILNMILAINHRPGRYLGVS
ncbi:YitT family protein [Mesorhizobium sp. VK25A]|uniref:YitT family protein n=1 Tax=Mesorhizobium vachelliae TaxID=3072309 RepID=A0ABU4ZZC0_9HYPH|nr:MULTISPECIES: YitT family protein [unclassified Mesorhizobium]MDX8530766.1 YitT family protein [Mesorhizobium sp. VK25D]MDX8542743.1 YitT family protein [Mesorhizobium sp. VK25A]